MKYEINILSYDAVFGLVNYGIKLIDSGNIDSYLDSRMRCQTCGAAWLAENYLEGYHTCPKCGAGKNSIFSMDMLHRQKG